MLQQILNDFKFLISIFEFNFDNAVDEDLLILLELNPVHLDLVVNELVDVGDHSAALYVHQYEAGDDLCVQG